MTADPLVVTGGEALAAALADPQRRDVALAAGDVPAGALEALRAALAGESTAATASALPGGQPGAGAVPSAHARLAGPISGLVLIRRSALDLLGDAPSDAGALLEAVTAAASAVAMQHLLVPEARLGGAEPDHVEDAAPADEIESPTERALRAAARSGRRLTVTVDLRCLGAGLGGTQVHALEAAAALARRAELDLRLLLPHETHPSARAALARLDTHAIAMSEVEAAVARGERLEPTDVFHRPFQITSPQDLDVAAILGRRLSVTHQDLIAYRAAPYHERPEAWLAFRRTTRLALARADAVLFESEHARADALADGLVEPHVTALAPIGVDHGLLGAPADPERPAALAADDRPFLLILGSDYAHKQRPFALRLTRALIDRGWGGRLVLAGPRVVAGGTAAAEAPLVAALGDRAVDLGPVGEAEKEWLYANAAAVAYPTTYEGFGLIPFEAAARGTPCLFAPVASLGELLDGIEGGLAPWDPVASAARAEALLADPGGQVEAIRARAAELTWDRHAERLAEAFARAVAAPERPAVRLAHDALAAERERGHWEGSYWHLHNAMGSAGRALVGPDDPLLDPAERRGLAALLRRGATGGPLRRVLRAAGGRD